jgi:hypothetical protein
MTACPAAQTSCNGACTNLQTDIAHCGSCTVTCGAGTTCQNGTCQTQCGAGQASCGGVCKTTVSDPQNCGTCGHACPSGQFCASGTCSASCPFQPCDTANGPECADTLTNPNHCGGCGAACKSGQSCAQGQCVAACPSGQTACNGACVDLMTSAASCGTCGVACSAGTPCISGHCGCPGGQTLCNGVCVDLTNDAHHCGACGTTCSGALVCQAGQCVAGCSAGLTSCAGGCVDTNTSSANCGACNQACPAAEQCSAGKCGCPNGGTLCDSACVDAQTNAEHCGNCTTKCGSTQTCVAGKCSCPNGQTACGDACVDTKTSNDHCGGCNQPCTGGESCQAGACKCPAGQTACGMTCVDTTMNDANCGGCGMACANGQTCMAGKCSGAGGVGADGCSSTLATNISLSRIDAFQSVQVGVMLNGAEIATSARNTDLVAGRETVFRIFVTPGSGFAARDLSARVTLVNGDASDEYFAKKSVSAASTLADAASTFNVTVPPDKITTSTKYHVELVDCGGAAPSGTAVAPRYPTTDDAALGARTTGGLKIVVVPISINNKGPATTDSFYDPFRAYMLAMYPISSISITAGTGITVPPPPNASGGSPDWTQLDWNGALDSMRTKRQADAPAADVYYFGMLMPTDTFQQYCGRGCTAGIGFVTSQNDASRRVAVGIGWTGSQALITMAHEVGHNHGRNHAPCVPQGGSISGVDPMYPYDGASIGVWGYNAQSKQLVNPSGITDIMGYCNNQWISDYTYDGLVNRVAGVDGAARVFVNPDVLARWRTLLLDSRGPRWGLPSEDLEPPAGAAEVAQIFDDHGDVIDYATVYRTEVSDIGAASIMVPEPQPGWYAIQVSGSVPHPFAAPVAVTRGF